MSTRPDNTHKFVRTHPSWSVWLRRPPVVALSFALLASYAVFLLPSAETESSLLFYLNINLFILYVLFCTGNVLADGKKPESLKMLVALALIAIMCWLFYRYSGAEWHRLREFFFNWEKLQGKWWILWQGLEVTLLLAFISGIGSVLIGLLVAILHTLHSPTLNFFLRVYIDVFRSIPMIVIMVFIFFALPFMGISLGSIVTTVLALSLGYGAYATECFRAGIESVHTGQLEAARSLGLSRWKTISKIILPQAFPVVIPPLTGILVAMLKDTAVASIVAAPELLKRARELYTSETNPTPLVAAALIYLMVLIPLVRVVNVLENKLGKKRSR
ncbi:MAG: amino acid ABC transporter permease [Desulfofustis sp.]|nr:amino acid ABC transporter permease [Desulfofustis sp.]NNK57513.1 amino acid ABC transporter permease [Desulfofustis sp.]